MRYVHLRYQAETAEEAAEVFMEWHQLLTHNFHATICLSAGFSVFAKIPNGEPPDAAYFGFGDPVPGVWPHPDGKNVFREDVNY